MSNWCYLVTVAITIQNFLYFNKLTKLNIQFLNVFICTYFELQVHTTALTEGSGVNHGKRNRSQLTPSGCTPDTKRPSDDVGFDYFFQGQFVQVRFIY